MWDIIKTGERGAIWEYPEVIAVNKPLDEALLIADRCRCGWEHADFRIKAAPLPWEKEGRHTNIGDGL